MDYRKFIVSDVYENERIDKFLTKVIQDSDEEITRSEIKKYFDEECITVNNKIVKPSYKLKINDEIVMTNREIVVEDIIKENIPLDIVYEDNDLLVINKPSGMVVHPSVGHTRGTLVNALMYHVDSLSDINGLYRPGIVHRIDKDTSGLLIVCKNNKAHNEIAKQLKDKTSKREYYALVYGNFEHLKGKIDAPIGRDPKERQRQAVVENGKPAVTHFTVLESYDGFSLLSCRLETGRTHQIRVHLSYIGHPVVGDPLYGPKKVIGKNGQYLHAKSIGFVHPTTNDYLEFDSSLPNDFIEKIEELKK